MKHRVLLRRALPLAVLAAVLYSAGWPASAFFFQKDEAVPSVAAMTLSLIHISEPTRH